MALESSEGAAIRAETRKLKRELTLLPLFGLLYFTVSGGTFGIESLVSSSGPGLALILIVLTPIVFSLPNVLMVRELSTMMPVEGGYYHWVKKAFGPFPGFMAGWSDWMVTWLDVAIYPVLAVTYLGYFVPALREGLTVGGVELPAELVSWLAAVVIIWLISGLQIRGARLSGLFTDWLGVLLLGPLVLMTILGIYAWIQSGTTVDLPVIPEGSDFGGALSVGLFVVMWNYMGWELPSTAGGEIVNPRKTYPRAMALVLVAAVATYLLPVVAGLYGGAGADGRWQLWGLEATSEQYGITADLVGQDIIDEEAAAVAEANGIPVEQVTLDDLSGPEVTAVKDQLTEWGVEPDSAVGWGLPEIAHAIGEGLGGADLGVALGTLVTIAAILSMVGLFVGNSLGGSRVPFAMAADGMFPRWMVKVHGRYGTPWVAIVVCGVVFSAFSWQAFAFLVVADVFLQSLVIMAEFAAMWKLRASYPEVPRQKVPGGVLGLVLVTVGPTAMILLAIVSQYQESGFDSIGWALVLAAVGVLLYRPFRRYLKPGVPDIDPFEGPAEMA